jgi:aminoglycoside phosphotransferase (APT) family kinase protein
MMLTSTGEFSIDTCLQPEAVRVLLQQALPGFADGRLMIVQLRIVKARRNASIQRNPIRLTLCYELKVCDTATGGTGTQQFYAKVYRNGASAQAAQGTTALHLPQLDMLMWAWPADPGLAQLPALLDPYQTVGWWGEPAQAVDVIRYEPEQRATLRYALHPGRPGPQALFAKTFCDERGALIHLRFEYFWALAQQDEAAPRVAQPLGWHPDTRTVWQAQAQGTPLRQALTSAPNAGLPGRLAHALATLHGAPLALAGPIAHDSTYWLTEIRRRHKKISRVAPELAERAARIAEALEEAAARLLPYAPTLIHGDCHPEQMWLDGDRVVLFDFDEFALGDPMEDIAAFVTRLGPTGAESALALHLRAAYAQLAPEHFDPHRLQWHLAVQQLLQASRAFIFQVSDWRDELERRFARAEALVAPMSMEVCP